MKQATFQPSAIARLALLLGVMGLIGGCGWTARDEFYRNRSLVLAPQAGDGSQVSSSNRIPAAPLATWPQMAQSPLAPSLRPAQ